MIGKLKFLGIDEPLLRFVRKVARVFRISQYSISTVVCSPIPSLVVVSALCVPWARMRGPIVSLIVVAAAAVYVERRVRIKVWRAFKSFKLKQEGERAFEPNWATITRKSAKFIESLAWERWRNVCMCVIKALL